mgnify:CR=1 FL=1
MRANFQNMGFLLEDDEQGIIDIRRTAPSPIILNYFSVMELSSPFLKIKE